MANGSGVLSKRALRDGNPASKGYSMTASRLYFDQQDHALLRMVNRVLERAGDGKSEDRLFAPELHPHGIKEMTVSRELRVAYAVINLLDSLEAGRAADRLLALRLLHDEVISTASSAFRRNTGRVLIQVMKDLVRAHGDATRQLMLAHDFRTAAAGRPRTVRALLKRYHLLEMPEEWDQLTFDHHVHDANTKGRKTPTHLIMDAWIKGIRSLTVIYYNFVEARAVQELLEAAAVMELNVRVGLEYRALFRGKYVKFIWEPVGMEDTQAAGNFMCELAVRSLMEDGRSVAAWQQRHVFAMLERYNEAHRRDIGARFGIDLPPVSKEEFLEFVGAGQPSILHLSELAGRRMQPLLRARLPELAAAHAAALASGNREERAAIESLIADMNALHAESVQEGWFTPQMNPMLPDPNLPCTDPDACPLFLRISPRHLLTRLSAIRRRSQVTLTLSGLTPEDVLELLYECEGRITHLELFNLRDYSLGKLPHCEEVSALQFAINQGSAVEVKRLIRDIIRRLGGARDEDAGDRRERLTEILHNIPRLQSFYRFQPLRTHAGSDSTSRSYRLNGMGFAHVETLPRSARKAIHDAGDVQRQIIPLHAEVESRYTYSPPPRGEDGLGQRLLAAARKLPGLRFLGFAKRHEWVLKPTTTRYCARGGSIATLGGFRPEDEAYSLTPRKAAESRPGAAYMNTRLANLLKVGIGFALTMGTFLLTQNWWVLVWFGAPIWFIITGFRNIVQAVLGGGGIRRSPLLRWDDYVSWSRISDSLLYTGISVPLLELVVRWAVLEKGFSLTSATDPLLFYTAISMVNGFYVTGHNLFRGLQISAAVGNLFRSVFAVPLSLLYNFLLEQGIVLLGIQGGMVLLAAGSAIISKAASDTVAGVIEGFADQGTNMNMRRWDYAGKLRQLFACFARLEVLLPEEDVGELLRRPRELMEAHGPEVAALEKSLLIHSLDLMYFYWYQPRALTMLRRALRFMTAEEREIFVRAQLVLGRKKLVSQLFVDGMVGSGFSRALAFYLEQYEAYLKDMSRLAGVPLEEGDVGAM